ncbi:MULTISPECIES: hypothetical protein [unclassified Enterobacter]|uniref:hypothetical protein n=1 Tax=unclassified Enterobacter TaxID=2608935 RepID=UPI003B43393B
MVGIDDLLIAFATAAGKSAGETIVKELLKGITGSLATKEDLANAVAQIENYVHQELMAVEARAIVIDVDTAIRNLKQYKNSGRYDDLLEQNTQQLLNRTASEIQAAINSDARYLWNEFVVISRFVAVYTTFWSVKALDLKQPNQIPNLVDAVVEGLQLLNGCLSKLHEMEDETISDLKVEKVRVRDEIGPKVHLEINFAINTRASFSEYRGRYGGMRGFDTGWIIRHDDENEAENRMRPVYNAHVARIQSESQSRQEKIYQPLVNAINALEGLLYRLKGPIASIEASFK